MTVMVPEGMASQNVDLASTRSNSSNNTLLSFSLLRGRRQGSGNGAGGSSTPTNASSEALGIREPSIHGDDGSVASGKGPKKRKSSGDILSQTPQGQAAGHDCSTQSGSGNGPSSVPNLISSSSSPAPASSSSSSNSTSGLHSLSLSNMLRRRRSAGNINAATNASTPGGAAPSPLANGLPPPPPIPSHGPRPQSAISPSISNAISPAASAAGVGAGSSAPNINGTHRIRLVPHLDSRRTLKFDPITRDVKPTDSPLRIGRFTDRSGLGLTTLNSLGSSKLAFKSKVVSRSHAEIYLSPIDGKFYIKDTKSSSGTFLNHSRLSPANVESRPFVLKDGDILQLGVDYQGGAEDIYKSVKIRVEIGREWQMAANAFNTTAFKNIKTLAGLPSTPSSPKRPGSSHSKDKESPAPPEAQPAKRKVGSGGKLGIPDCCICLFAVTIRQALFIAPCSHTFHYKCIRPLLESHHPGFSCPLCRTFADLEEDVEVEIDMEWVEGEGEEGEETEDENKGDGPNGSSEGDNEARGRPQLQDRSPSDMDVTSDSEALRPTAGAHGNTRSSSIPPAPAGIDRILSADEASGSGSGSGEDIDGDGEGVLVDAPSPLPDSHIDSEGDGMVITASDAEETAPAGDKKDKKKKSKFGRARLV